MVRTVQIAAVKKDYGKSYKVAPMTTENVTNAIGCFLLNGTKEGPTELQSVLPDLKGYHVGNYSIRKLYTYHRAGFPLWSPD